MNNKKDNITIYLPTDWKDITIKMYQEIERLKEYKGNKINFTVELLKIVSNLSDDEINEIKISDLNLLYNKLSFLNTEIPTDLKQEFIINDITYVSPLDFSELTTNQFIDLQDALAEKGDNKYKLSEILACIYVPKGCTYNKEHKRKDVTNLFYDKLDIVTAYSLTVFFCSYSMNLLTNIQFYLEQENKENMKQIIELAKTL